MNVMPEYKAKDIIKVAQKYTGYIEKESNRQLDDMSANAGDKNYTVFAKKYEELTGINDQGSPWCDMFVDCCFAEAYGKEKAMELLGGYSAYTPTSAQNFMKMEQWHTEKPEPGDVIFFKNNKRICHTGIVYKATKTNIYTIEGNTSAGKIMIPNGGEVCKKQYRLDNPDIAGYGRPKYDL